MNKDKLIHTAQVSPDPANSLLSVYIGFESRPICKIYEEDIIPILNRQQNDKNELGKSFNVTADQLTQILNKSKINFQIVN